jgi:hypothetical protein
MRLRSPETLARHMAEADCSQARLARGAKCSRQFVHQLVKGHAGGCSVETARSIEGLLGVAPGTLFVPGESPADGSTVA